MYICSLCHSMIVILLDLFQVYYSVYNFICVYFRFHFKHRQLIFNLQHQCQRELKKYRITWGIYSIFWSNYSYIINYDLICSVIYFKKERQFNHEKYQYWIVKVTTVKFAGLSTTSQLYLKMMQRGVFSLSHILIWLYSIKYLFREEFVDSFVFNK